MKSTNAPLQFTLVQKPPSVGAYWIAGVHRGLGIYLDKRPRWFHRVMMRWAFGWEWLDETDRNDLLRLRREHKQ